MDRKQLQKKLDAHLAEMIFQASERASIAAKDDKPTRAIYFMGRAEALVELRLTLDRVLEEE